MQNIEKEILEMFVDKICKTDISKNLKVLICPVGSVGAGKTTVVKPLAELLKLPRISADEIRKVLKEKGENYDSVGKISFEVLEHFLKLGYGAVIDSDCATKLEDIEKLRKKNKLKVIFIHINPPEEFILNKLRNYTGEKWLTDDQEKMVENYFVKKRVDKKFLGKIKFDYEVDTSSPDLGEMIQNIAAEIKTF